MNILICSTSVILITLSIIPSFKVKISVKEKKAIFLFDNSISFDKSRTIEFYKMERIMKTTLLVIALTVASILFAISTESPVMTTKMKAAVVESLDNAISTNYYFTDRIDRITSTYKKTPREW